MKYEPLIPQLSYKNFKFAAFASEETLCFTATLYLNKTRVGTVRSDGHGGPAYIEQVFNEDALKKVEALVEALPEEICHDLPPINGKPFAYKPSLDSVLESLAADTLTLRDCRRILKKVAIYENGRVYNFKVKADQLHLIRDGVKQKFPKCVILNEIPEEDAVNYILQAGATP